MSRKKQRGQKEGGVFKKEEFWYDRSGIVLSGEEILIYFSSQEAKYSKQTERRICSS